MTTKIEALGVISEKILEVQAFFLDTLETHIRAAAESKKGENLDEDRSSKDIMEMLNEFRQRTLFSSEGIQNYETEKQYLQAIVLEINCIAARRENAPHILEKLKQILSEVSRRFSQDFSLDQQAGKKENTIIILSERLRENLAKKFPQFTQIELSERIQKVLRKTFYDKTPEQVTRIEELIRSHIENISNAVSKKIAKLLKDFEEDVTIERITEILADNITALIYKKFH